MLTALIAVGALAALMIGYAAEPRWADRLAGLRRARADVAAARARLADVALEDRAWGLAAGRTHRYRVAAGQLAHAEEALRRHRRSPTR